MSPTIPTATQKLALAQDTVGVGRSDLRAGFIAVAVIFLAVGAIYALFGSLLQTDKSGE